MTYNKKRNLNFNHVKNDEKKLIKQLKVFLIRDLKILSILLSMENRKIKL